MKKKIDLSKPKPVIPAFNGPAHYARMAAMQAPATEQGLVVAIGEKKYELKLPLPLMLTEISGVVVPPEPVEPTTGKPDTKPRTKAHTIGINARPWEPIEKLPPMLVRCYISSGWIWQPGGIAADPMHQAESEYTHNLGDYLVRCKAAGKDVLLCIHETPSWLRGSGRDDNANDYPPIQKGAKRDDPKSYLEYARFMWQVAARYGYKKHDDSLLRVDTTPRWQGDIINTKQSGLKLLRFIECWNEEKWWLKGTEGYIEPEAMAALMSACFDGHEGTLGPQAGIRSADPAMAVIMPGLSDFDMDYVQKMHVWFLANRKDRKWPCDAMQFHHYSNIGNRLGKHPPTWIPSGGCTPDQDQNFPTGKAAVAFAKSVGLPAWLGECGFDTIGPSPMHIKPTAGKTVEQTQGEAINRTIDAYLADGWERVVIYVAGNEPSFASGGLYTSTGILSSQSTGYTPKESAAIIQQKISGYSAV
jgi:hypothetical protein